MQCSHGILACINEFEVIRKYRCQGCGAVMMCACEQGFGARFLPHQLSECRDPATHNRVQVTLGFQPKVCRECRGLPAEAFPVSQIYGRTTKIKRYYWRELLKRELELYGDWAAANGVDLLVPADEAARIVRGKMSEQALQEIKHLHETTPKYMFAMEQSQADLILECGVEVVALNATYVSDAAARGVQVLGEGRAVGVEDYVKLHFGNQGYECIAVESVPFHVLFGVYLWLLIQDPDDDKVRSCGFGNRTAFDNQEVGEMVRCQLPVDFGTSVYAERRREAIDRHFEENISTGELEWLFEYWLLPSEPLRQYLWAHRDADVQIAKKVMRVLPPECLVRIVRYLVDSYWERYLGWPDLLVYRGDEFFFVEVKSSRDSLSDHQKRWVRDNHKSLKLPFKIVKVHKSGVVNAADLS
jgi:hypothetical protein